MGRKHKKMQLLKKISEDVQNVEHLLGCQIVTKHCERKGKGRKRAQKGAA